MKKWSSMLAAMVVVLGLATPLWAYEVVVLPGNEAVIEWLNAENWWGQEKKGEQLQVPRIMITGISERGQKYVDTLRGIIRVNNLAIADNAVFRDESMRFLLTTADEASAAKLRKDIEAMQKSGEIEKIVKRMRLE